MVKLLLTLLPALALTVAACETTRPSAAPAGSDPGRVLYERSCQRCHALFMPASFTASEWHYFVGKYGRKARLEASEAAAVYAYLARHARDAGRGR